MYVRTIALWLLFGLIMFGRQLDAQGLRITGRVFDEEHLKRPGIAGVRIQLVNALDTTVQLETVVANDGKLLLDVPAPGRYSVKVSRLGYRTFEWVREFTSRNNVMSIGMWPASSGDYSCPRDSVLEPVLVVRVRDQDARPVTRGIIVLARGDSSVDTLSQHDDAFVGRTRHAGLYVLEASGWGVISTRSAPIAIRKVGPRTGLCGDDGPRALFIERSGRR